MTKNYLKQFLPSKQHTPQNQPIPGTNQVPNSAGGYAWEVDQWARLRRFLILGSEGGSYYASEQTLTAENAVNVLKCIHADGERTVKEIVTLSNEGRAPKNDPAIFALAMAAAHGTVETRKAALDALPKVCRTGTHLFAFAEYAQGMRGWGRAMRRGVAGWYKSMNPRQLAYQVVKYRQRNGWTHTDTLRLAHPKPANDTEGLIYRWVTARADDKKQEHIAWTRAESVPQDEALAFIWAFEQAQMAKDVQTILNLIEKYDLPREAIPTDFLRDPAVWEALLPKMPMTAMIRNLATMTRNGFLVPMSAAERTIVHRLASADLLKKARVHPIDVLSALRVYALGYSLRGQALHYGYAAQKVEKEWTPTPRVLDALDTAFELAFKNVEPTNKRYLLALDVSGSMAVGTIGGVPGLTPREGAAAMSMVTARTEKEYSTVAFQNQIVPLNISAKMRLDDVLKATSNLPFGATDCAQPMLYAMEKKLQVDVFVIYTDSETWFNPSLHPMQALRDYRQKTGIPAKLIVVGMIANRVSIADPNDGGMLDIVGFDSSAPELMADFVRGRI